MFDIDSFADIGGQTRKGMSPAVWSYESLEDSLADILSPEYFEELALHVSPGDFINVSLLDGKKLITVLDINLMPQAVVIDPEVFAPNGGGGGSGNVTTSDVLAATQLILGNGGVDLLTEPDLTYDGSIFNVAGNIGIGSGDRFLIDGKEILRDDGAGSIDLMNINVIDFTTTQAIQNQIIDLPVLANITSGQVIGPSGAWQGDGFNAGPNDGFLINFVPVIDDTTSIITLRNIALLDAVTLATIQLITGDVNAVGTLRGTELLTGVDSLFGKQIKSNPSLTFSNTIAGAVLNGNTLGVGVTDDTPLAITFNNDGSQFYFVGSENNSVYEYALSTNYDLSSASLTNTFSVNTQDSDPRGLAFNDDGSKMFIVGRNTDSVYQYALGTNFDISTAVVIGGGFLLSDPAAAGIAFNTTGSKMYIVGMNTDFVFEFDLGTDFDSSTAVFFQMFSIFPQDPSPRDIHFTASGLEMLICGVATNRILSYVLSVAFDISTAVFNSALDISAQDFGPSGVTLNDDETILYMMGAVGTTAFEYDIIPFFNVGVPTTISVETDQDKALSLKSLTDGGDVGMRVGDRNPQGLVNGQGPDVYYSEMGALSGTYESRSLTPDSAWLKRSVLPSDIHEFVNSAELDALASGGIITITSNETWHVRAPLTTANRIVVDAGMTLSIVGEYNSTASINYSGTDTFFTVNGFLNVRANMFLTASSTGTLLNALSGSVVNIEESGIVDWDLLGSKVGAGAIFISESFFTNISAGFTFTNAGIINVMNVVQGGTALSGALFAVNTNDPNSSYIFSNVDAQGLAGTGFVFDFDTRMNNDLVVNITQSKVLTGDLFKKTVLANATINTVADGSPATGVITAMADNGAGGTTVSCTTTYFEDEEVTQSGTTNYNDTYQIFNVVAGVSFDIIEPFVGDDAAGSVDSVRIVMSLAGGHGISPGDSIKAIDMNFYNAFYTVLDESLDDIVVNNLFVGTDSGSIEREVSLDQSDPRIISFLNTGFPSSAFIACAHVNDNSTVNPAIVNGVFRDMLFGTVGVALRASTTMERWKLVNELLGIFEYIGAQQFDGRITFDFTVMSSGGTNDFRFKWQKDVGAGFVDLPDNVEALVAVGSDAQGVSKTFPLKAVKGDRIMPLITRNSGASTITTTYATVYASMQ